MNREQYEYQSLPNTFLLVSMLLPITVRGLAGAICIVCRRLWNNESEIALRLKHSKKPTEDKKSIFEVT